MKNIHLFILLFFLSLPLIIACTPPDEPTNPNGTIANTSTNAEITLEDDNNLIFNKIISPTDSNSAFVPIKCILKNENGFEKIVYMNFKKDSNDELSLNSSSYYVFSRYSNNYVSSNIGIGSISGIISGNVIGKIGISPLIEGTWTIELVIDFDDVVLDSSSRPPVSVFDNTNLDWKGDVLIGKTSINIRKQNPDEIETFTVGESEFQETPKLIQDPETPGIINEWHEGGQS